VVPTGRRPPSRHRRRAPMPALPRSPPPAAGGLHLATDQATKLGGIAGVAAHGGGDVVVAAGAQQADGEVPQAGHDPGAVPVRAWEASSAKLVRGRGAAPRCPSGRGSSRPGGRGGPGGGEVGDRVDHQRAPPPVAERPSPAGHADRLAGVGEVQAGDSGDLQAAGLHAAVAAVAGVVSDGDITPGQELELVVERELVGLHEQQVAACFG
jgi:hypothetical protein